MQAFVSDDLTRGAQGALTLAAFILVREDATRIAGAWDIVAIKLARALPACYQSLRK